MQGSSFLMPCPLFNLTAEERAAFDHLYQATRTGGLVTYNLPYHKWQYLSYLCDTKTLVLHGSQNAEIGEIEPRQARDTRAFSNQRAIYATTDGIWAIFYAILDRQRYPKMTLFNSCFRIGASTGLGEPWYFFSITYSALLRRPWCEGVVYVVPRQSFAQEAPQRIEGMEIVFPHWISASPATPVARLRVGPDDFPFLSQIHGHNDEKLVKLAVEDPNGFPWPDALEC